MKMRDLSRPQTLALLGSFIAILLASLVPALLGASRYDPMVALTLVMTVAILATAAFAAYNLVLFRETREAESTPVIDAQIREVYVRGSPQLHVHLINVGRGISARLEVALWWTEADLVAWIPHRLDGVGEVLRPGEETEGHVDSPNVHFAVQHHFRSDMPDVVLQVRYRDALKRDIETFQAFEFGHDEATGESLLLPSPQKVPDALSSLDGKQQLLDAEITRVLRDLPEIERRGLEVKGRVGHRYAGIQVLRDGEALWQAQAGISEPVYHFGRWLRDAVPDLFHQIQQSEDSDIASNQSKEGG